MAELAGVAAARVGAAVEDERTRDARADREHDDVAVPARGAEPVLGVAGGAHVVAEGHGQPGRGLGEGTDGRVAPPEVGGEDADARHLVDEAGHAHADGDGRDARRLVEVHARERADRRHDATGRVGGIEPGRRAPQAEHACRRHR